MAGLHGGDVALSENTRLPPCPQLETLTLWWHWLVYVCLGGALVAFHTVGQPTGYFQRGLLHGAIVWCDLKLTSVLLSRPEEQV